MGGSAQQEVVIEGGRSPEDDEAPCHGIDPLRQRHGCVLAGRAACLVVPAAWGLGWGEGRCHWPPPCGLADASERVCALARSATI